jgi:hypothetical protein
MHNKNVVSGTVNMGCEWKYYCDANICTAIKNYCNANASIDEYCKMLGFYEIETFYLITSGSLAGRIRIRHYIQSEQYVAEYKGKIGSMRYKERYNISYSQFLEIINCNSIESLNSIFLKNNIALSRYISSNSSLVHHRIYYYRQAWHLYKENIRLTIDTDLKIYCNSTSTDVVPMNIGIVELKFENELISTLKNVYAIEYLFELKRRQISKFDICCNSYNSLHLL